MTRAGRTSQWINLIDALKYSLIFAAIQVALPFTVFPGLPGSDFVGGLFSGMSGAHVFWAAAASLSLAWTLMFTAELVVGGYAERKVIKARAQTKADPDLFGGGFLPPSAVKFFKAPANIPAVLCFSALALPAIVICVHYSVDGWINGLWAAAGAAAAYVLVVLMSAPVLSIDGDYRVLPGTIANGIYKASSGLRLAGAFRFIYRRLSWLVGATPLLGYVTEEAWPAANEQGLAKEGRVLSRLHFFAMTAVLVLLLTLLLLGNLFYPFPTPKLPFRPPALAYIYGLLILLTWTFQFVDFHASRIRIPAPLVILVWIAGVYGTFQSGLLASFFPQVDHYFYVFERGDTVGAAPSPIEVARGAGSRKNLVIVTATGGGIQAAGWITYGLQRLTEDGIVDPLDIRVLSTVSGGSVGAAFYLDAVRGGAAPADPGLDRRGVPKGGGIYKASVASSLRSVGYSITNYDFWLAFMGRFAFWVGDTDRGMMIERKWAQTASGIADATVPSMQSLGAEIRSGRVPAPIMNATALETGRRVMITPISFAPREALPGLTVESARAQTLFELVTTDKPMIEDAADASTPAVSYEHLAASLDIGIWTAARLSASFSYVSPAARAKLHPKRSSSSLSELAGNFREFHLIDGGYYDNYGIASAIDFLEPVLEARRAGDGDLTFERVLIIQLRAYHVPNPADADPESGFLAAIAGPIQGVLNIRDGAAFTRNEEELQRLIQHWNRGFDERPGGALDVKVETITFEPDPGRMPLSWHLTREQKDALRESWQGQKDLKDKLERIETFLR